MSLFDSPVREVLTIAASVGASLFTIGRKVGALEHKVEELEREQQTFATRTALEAVSVKLNDVHADVREIRARLDALLLRNP